MAARDPLKLAEEREMAAREASHYAAELPTDTNRNIYLVTKWRGGGNDRVRKLLWLRACFGNITLVTPNKFRIDTTEELCVPPLPNPTGILRMLGLGSLKAHLDRFLFFPSTVVLFIVAVIRPLSRRIARDLANGRQVTLVTIAPPHGLGIVGLIIKKRFPQIRWIIDWQDLWTYDENYYLTLPYRYRGMARKLERRMLGSCDLNVTTNEAASNVLREVYGVDSARLHSINHHFHAADLELHRLPTQEIQRWRSDPVIRIGFFGTLLKPPRVPGQQLIAAVEHLRAEGLGVELHVHGNRPKDYEVRSAWYEQRGTFFHGRASHEQALALLERYDYLFILLADLPNARAVMSIKLPHYLQLGIPIIAIVPSPSAIAEMIDSTGGGFVIPSSADWHNALHELLTKHNHPTSKPTKNETAINSLSWDHISRDWAYTLCPPK